MRLAPAAAAFGLLLWAAGAAGQAEPAPAWAEPCTNSGTAAAAPGRMRSADELRYNDPVRAWALACARLRQPGAPFDAWLALADAMIAADSAQPAAHLLATLDAAAARAPHGAAGLALARAVLARHQGQRATAGELAEQALALLQREPDPPLALMVGTLLERAAALRALNRSQGLDQAQALLDDAERLLRAAGLRDTYLMGDLLNQRTMLAYARDDYRSVEALALQERDLVRRLSGPDAPAQLDALATLASITSTQRRYADALAHLLEGRRIGRLAPAASRPAYLGVLNTLSPVLVDMGRPLEALEVANEAHALAVSIWGDDSPQTLTALERKAGAQGTLQRYVQARRSFDRLAAIVERADAQVPLVRRLRVLDSAAAFYLALNDLDAAQRIVERMQGLMPSDGTLGYWRGRLLLTEARLAGAQSEWQRADALYAQARPLLAGVVPAQYLTRQDAAQCDLQLRAGSGDAAACARLAAGLDGLRDAVAADRVQARTVLARQAAAGDRGEQAQALLAAALAAAQSDQTARMLWVALNAAAGQQRAAGRPTLAVLLAKKAIEQIEAVRTQFGALSQLQAGYLRDKHAVYRRLADWLAEDVRIDEALQVVQLLKTEEYRDFVGGHDGAVPAPRGALLRWTDAERRWLARSPLSSPQRARRGATPPTAQETQTWERTRAQAWQQALQRPWPQTAARPAAPAPATQATPAHELSATLFIGEKHLNIVFHGTAPGSQRLQRIPADPQALARDIGRLLARLEQRDAGAALALLQSLYGRVAAPLDAQARRSGASRWRLQLDGELRYLPFAALHDGRAHLVERVVIEQQAWRPAAAAAAVVAPAGARADTVAARAGARRVQAFGSTREAPGLPALPGVAKELCAIVDGPVEDGSGAVDCGAGAARGVIAGNGYVDAAFTLHRLRRAAAEGRPERFDLLHIGTHFVLQPGDIGRSWMLLGDGQRLQLQDLLSWRLDSQDLVTLSACQTAAGGGGEVEGLSSLVLGLGAQAVIASLWQVDDHSTSALMRDLYAEINAGAEPAVALRNAQLRALMGSRAGRVLPMAWAAFVLTGRGR